MNSDKLTEALKLRDQKIKKIEDYGLRYVKEFLFGDIQRRNVLYDEWYDALFFFFSKSFYRGRKDEISDKFYERACQTLDEYFWVEGDLDNFNSSEFSKRLLKNYVNNSVDRRMVCETIEFIKKIPGNNIVKYAVDKIKRDKVTDVFEDLKNIYGIGDKLASLYLRDIVFIYTLPKYIKKEYYIYLQPVDTWVKQVANALWIIEPDDNDNEVVSNKIIKECLRLKVSPLLFNAGAWYCGKHSFKLFFENL